MTRSGPTTAPPDPRLRAALDAVADAVVEAVVRDVEQTVEPTPGAEGARGREDHLGM